MEPVSRPGYERDVATAKALSPEDRFAAAWLEGRVVDFDNSVTSALAAIAPYASVLPSAGTSARTE